MTDPLAEQDDAGTPLRADEREGLILSYITLRGELNEAEQANILEADAGATRAAYVAALRAADNHDYGPLLAFVRS